MKAKIAISLAFIGAGSASPAWATDVFTLEGFGAISRGLGGSAVSLDVGPAGIMSNPATLSLSTDGLEPEQRSQLLIGLDMVATNINAYDDATGANAASRTHGHNRGPYFAPELAFIRRSGNLTFGIGAFALGVNRPGFSGGIFNSVMRPYRGSQWPHSSWLRLRRVGCARWGRIGGDC